MDFQVTDFRSTLSITGFHKELDSQFKQKGSKHKTLEESCNLQPMRSSNS